MPRPRVGGGDFSNSGYQIVLSICTSRVSDAPSNFFRVVAKGLCTVQNSRGFHHYAIESPVITANLPNFITEITRLSFKVSLWGKSHLSQSNRRILSPTSKLSLTRCWKHQPRYSIVKQRFQNLNRLYVSHYITSKVLSAGQLSWPLGQFNYDFITGKHNRTNILNI